MRASQEQASTSFDDERRQEAADQDFESNGSLCDSSSGQMAHGERRACEPAVSHGHRPQQLAAFRRSWRGLAAISCDLLRILYGTSTIVASTAVQVSTRVHIERYYVRFVKVTLLTPPPRGPRLKTGGGRDARVQPIDSSVIYGVTLSASAARLCVMQCSCLLMCKRTMADCKEGSQDIWYLTSGMGGEGQQTHLLWKTPVPHEGSRMCSTES